MLLTIKPAKAESAGKVVAEPIDDVRQDSTCSLLWAGVSVQRLGPHTYTRWESCGGQFKERDELSQHTLTLSRLCACGWTAGGSAGFTQRSVCSTGREAGRPTRERPRGRADSQPSQLCWAGLRCHQAKRGAERRHAASAFSP